MVPAGQKVVVPDTGEFPRNFGKLSRYFLKLILSSKLIKAVKVRLFDEDLTF